MSGALANAFQLTRTMLDLRDVAKRIHGDRYASAVAEYKDAIRATTAARGKPGDYMNTLYLLMRSADTDPTLSDNAKATTNMMLTAATLDLFDESGGNPR